MGRCLYHIKVCSFLTEHGVFSIFHWCLMTTLFWPHIMNMVFFFSHPFRSVSWLFCSNGFLCFPVIFSLLLLPNTYTPLSSFPFYVFQTRLPVLYVSLLHSTVLEIVLPMGSQLRSVASNTMLLWRCSSTLTKRQLDSVLLRCAVA